MLIIELHKNVSIFFLNPDPVRITRPNVTTNRELDDIMTQIAAEHPDTTHMKIFYEDNDQTLEIATIEITYYGVPCYLYTNNYYRAFELMKRGKPA